MPTTTTRPGPASATTPWDAYRLASRGVTTAVVVTLVLLSALAWHSTAEQASSMSGMVSGLADVGRAMPPDTAVVAFLGMWTVMMVAMMFPAVAPVVLAHRAVVVDRGEGARPTLAFVGGYLLVWTAVGIVPLGVLMAVRQVSAQAAGSRWLAVAAGTTLVVAGAYQFSPLKDACLRACRLPLSFVLTHDFTGGSASALRAGLSHGLHCLGCCWALMGVMVVVGLMNLVWMAGLTVLFMIEKHSRHARVVGRWAGSGLIVLGGGVLLWPGLLGVL